MKNLLFIINIVLIFAGAGCSPKSPENRRVEKPPRAIRNSSIDDILIELLKAHPNLKAGMELLPTLNDIISAPDEEIVVETEADAASRVSAMVGKHTDYECRYQNHWLTIVPRPQEARFDSPSALRVCVAPAVKGMPVREFLRKIKGARPEEPITLAQDSSFYIPNEPQGEIDSTERTVPCFELLCGIAEQLSVRCWRVNHMVLQNLDLPGKILYPLKLDRGLVRFHAPGAIRSGTGSGK